MLPDADARIKRGIQDIREKREQGVSGRDDQQDRLDHLDVGALDRLPGQIANAA